MGFFTFRERGELNKLAEVEGEIRDFVRQREDSLRDDTGAGAQQVADRLASLIGRVAGSSIQEIDNVTAGLQALRGELQSQGERVQRDIVGYATLSQSAMQSTKLVSENLAQWKKPAAVRATNTESPALAPGAPPDNPGTGIEP